MAVNPSEMPYPEGTQAQLARFPIVLYRMGLGPLLAKRVAVLTTRGRRTGLLRHTPVGYVRDGDVFYVISGWGERSDWYKNLQQNADATLQIGSWRFAVRAEMLESAEEIDAMVEAVKSSDSPGFAEFIERVAAGDKSKLKAVRFVPTGYPPEGDIPQDLQWVPWAVGGLMGFLLLRALLGGGKKKAKPKAPEAKPEKVEKRPLRKAPKEKEKKATKKKGKAGLLLKLAKAAPVLIGIFRKFSEAKEKEDGMSTKDWLQIAPMVVGVIRTLAS